jgi:hypothetical protein
VNNRSSAGSGVRHRREEIVKATFGLGKTAPAGIDRTYFGAVHGNDPCK